MREDLGSLYDVHADRLYAYCWSLVGDRLAGAAVGDTFGAAVHRPPRGDGVLWLYALARNACAGRGAFTGELGGPLFGGSDPLLRAAAALRADHREVLLLHAGEWLEIGDIARVLGIAPDTAAQLLHAARTRLERSVLDLLMRGTAEPQPDLITAFEKGRLPRLLARRAPARAPGGLRAEVLARCEGEAHRPVPALVTTSPLVVIGPERPRRGADRERRGLSRGLGAAAGVAASAAAVIGLLVSWPAAKGGSGGGSATVVPTAGEGRTHPASVATGGDPRPALSGSHTTGSHRATGNAPTSSSPATSRPQATSPFNDPARPGRAPASSRPPASTPAGKPAGQPSSTPVKPAKPSPPPAGDPTTPPPATTPPDTPSDPTTPPDGGSGAPTEPPTTPPTTDPAVPAPSPTSNPAPQPTGD